VKRTLPVSCAPSPMDGAAGLPRRGRVRAALGSGLLSAAMAATASTDPALELPDADRRAIEDVAGAGLIAGTLPASRLAEPGRYLDPGALPKTYRVRDGDGRETDEHYRWEGSAGDRAKPTWRYRSGDTEIGFVARDADGSYVLSGIEDLKEKALTRYQPAEPLLLKGMLPGEERARRLDVRVYDSAEPDAVVHRGTLDVAHRYLGAYRIKTPSGVYDTILTRSVFDGSVGPAHLRDVQYRFFGEGVGIVATVEIRDVTAAIVYHSEMRVARMLSVAPQQHAECSSAASAAAAADAAPNLSVC